MIRSCVPTPIALQEAVARIRFCISESLVGVITGEVGVDKTVAVRAAISQQEATAHHIIYVAPPTFGARGLHLISVHVVEKLYATTLFDRRFERLAAESIAEQYWT